MKIVTLAVALSALCLMSFAEEPAKAKAAELLTKDEAKEVEAVISSMFEAGFPNTAKASVYVGKISVRATFDPKFPPLPSSASKTQMTLPNSPNMANGFEFEGLHFKLADGSCLISLAYHFKPKGDDVVDFSAATEVNLEKLTATAAAAKAFNAEKDAAKYLDGFVPAHRARATAEMNKYVPVTFYLKLRPDDLPQALVLLHRAGWADAPGASLVVADQRARNYWQLKPWTTAPDGVFDPLGAYPNFKDEEEVWKKSHPQVQPETPQAGLRHALYRWCRAQMMVEQPEDAMLPLNVAAAAAKALVDPKDPQGNGARIDALLAGAKLPVTPGKDADLPARLQSWEARARMPRMMVSGGVGGPAKGSISMSTSFSAPVAAYAPQKADLDALVALLADERPSRFWDFSGPRTVGDNAWRALATLLKSDPRTLAAHAADKPWTAAERKAAAAAVQKWWKDHRKEFVEK